MTRNKIIASLEEQATDKEDFVDKDDADDVFSLDIQALREAAELLRHGGVDRSRWKGCLYCKADLDGYSTCFRDINGRQRNMHIPEGEAAMVMPGRYSRQMCIPIAYCPFCGRPLTKESWAELEEKIGGSL